jgi:hypothetical protein
LGQNACRHTRCRSNAMNWCRIFWLTVGGLVLVTLVSGCHAPDVHGNPWSYFSCSSCEPSKVGK